VKRRTFGSTGKRFSYNAAKWLIKTTEKRIQLSIFGQVASMLRCRAALEGSGDSPCAATAMLGKCNPHCAAGGVSAELYLDPLL